MTVTDISPTIAALVRGAWRPTPPALHLEADAVVRVIPQLVGSGAAGLAWRRIAPTGLAADPRLAPLRRAAQRQALAKAIGETMLVEVVSALNGADIVPLIFKGWALGQAYTPSSLRPAGDFDLLVRPADHGRAVAVLTAMARPAASKPAAGQFVISGASDKMVAAVDLHRDLPPSHALPIDAVFARARPARLAGGVDLLVPAPEDHLRLVILHCFKHGAWRPLWLADIAAMAEAAGPDFDWALCQTAEPFARAWTAVGIGLAREILDCRPPEAATVTAPPPWLIRTVFTEWQAPYARRFRGPAPEASIRFIGVKIASYWLNPVAAALARGTLPPARRPLAHQIAYFVTTIGRAVLKAAGRPPREGP